MLIAKYFHVQSFKNMITLCLAKDPSKRPSAEQLLRHPFFKQAQSSEYIYQHVLDGLSPLSERVKNLKVVPRFLLKVLFVAVKSVIIHLSCGVYNGGSDAEVPFF